MKKRIPPFLRFYSRTPVLAAGFAAAALLIAGCGEPRVPVHPVSGKILFNGQPAAGAQVVLHAVNGAAAEGVVPVGVVKPDGTFKIGVYEDGDGAPAGEYVATVQWFKVVGEKGGGGGRGPNVLPKEYASRTASPIKVSVNDGPTEIPPIEIRK